MKKLLLLFLTMLLCVSGFSQAVIDPILVEEVNRHNDDDLIKIIVIMKSQYDREQLNRRADYFVTRAERREFVVNELKEFAMASQYDLQHSLSEMQRNGLVSAPTVLWMANAVYFDATKAVIQDLSRRNDIGIIGYAIEHNWIPDGEEANPAPTTREITQNVIQVGADKVWDLDYKGEGVVVAVIDTGVNYNHVDLADHLWDGGEEFPHHGYDVKNHDNNPMDDHGHGSHCSGTVCGDGTAGSQTGMAPEATLMCVKCLDANGSGGAQSISEGIQWAVEHGCDLFSMSLGLANSSIAERTLLRNTCEAALDAGVVAAIAAGNEGNQIWQYPLPNNVRVPGSCPPPYMDEVQGENPGNLSCSVCIGAVDYNDAAANFTSHGPVTWTNTSFGDYPYNPGIGLIRPDVCAPGVNIKSLNYATNTGYTLMSGTSMATPCAAGCMALMLSKDINLMPSEVCRILEETAVPLAEGKSNIYGFGRIDVFAAVEAIQLGAIRYYDFAINDPEGNGNFKLNPGETVMMSLTLENITDEEVNNVGVVLSTHNTEVTIMDDAVEFPSFAPNETLTVENAFAFSVTENVTSGQNIKFNITVSVDGEVKGNFGFKVEVYDYAIQYASTVVLNDDDNNGLLSPGETADLRIIIDNVGNELAQMLRGSLMTDYEFVTINDVEESFNTIGVDMMGYADFNVTLDSVAPEGFTIPFTLDLVDAHGKHNELDFNFNNMCRIFFVLHDSGGNGWQGNYLRVSYSDGMPLEQLTLENGSEATIVREVSLGSRIMLHWTNGQAASDCSFELTYEDGTVIFESSGGFSGNKVFTINCANGSSAPELCNPIQNLTYTLEDHDVVLTWDAPRDSMPMGYEVYRETVLLSFTDELTYTDHDLENGFYNYCVYAVYEDCQSEYACELVEVSCQGVKNLDYSLDDDLLLTLTWETPDNPVGWIEYQVYLDDELQGSTNELSYAFPLSIGEHDINVKAVFDGCEKDAYMHICILDEVENLSYTLENNMATVTWDAMEGVSQYEVTVNGQVHSFVEGTQYTFEVESGLTLVKVIPMTEVCHTLDAEIEICYCKPAEDLSFVLMDETGLLHFVWSNIPDAEYYEVVYNGSTTQVMPENAGATGFSFDAMVGENTICVTVHSIYGCNSELVCMTKNVCPAVDGFDYSFNGNEVTVTWNGDADSYSLRIDGSEWVTVETNAYTATMDDGHQIEVTPVYEDCMALTATYWFSVTNIAPEIHITDVHEGYITTAWDAVDDAVSYNFYRDGELIVENLTELTYKDTEMSINAEHCYAVQSVFEKGVSDQSEAACANYFAGLNETDDSVTIFPNPTSDKVTIQCTGMTLIEIYSAEGKLVQRIKVADDTYQLGGLESGIYTVRIHKGEEVLARRVVKM